ncbi:QTRTD1 family protein [Megaselia abdita]
MSRKIMNFVTEKVCQNSSAKSGKFTKDSSSFPTPLLLQTTKGGSIPHLAKEVYEYVTTDQPFLQISLSNTEQMRESLDAFEKGIAKFVGFPSSPTFLVMKSPTEISPSGFNEGGASPLFGRKGKELLTPEKYIKLVEVFQPDMYHSLPDSDTNIDSSKKRLRKSLIRNLDFFENSLEIHKTSERLSKSMFFAPIVGGFCKITRTECVKLMKPRFSDVDGFLIDGLHNNGAHASKLELSSLKEIVSHTIEELGEKEKPKVMVGAYSPLAVLEMIKLGVDVFDSSYVYIASKNFKALTFNFDLNTESKVNEFALDLSDPKYKEDFSPLLDNCTCLTCTKHTKAYINHLIVTKELLAPILLMIHNTKHYLNYFEAIRKSVQNDNIQEMITLLESQVAEQDIEDSFEGRNSESDQVEAKKRKLAS